MKIKELRKVFMNGILNENPTFRLLLGMCPTLAISKAASSGLGMGLAATFVLVFSNLVISLLRTFSSSLKRSVFPASWSLSPLSLPSSTC